MQRLVSAIQSNIKRKKQAEKTIVIDNVFFRFHYRLTTMLLIVISLMITSQELIGANIKCVGPASIPAAILNRYCYFLSTFTVARFMNDSLVDTGYALQPGVGPIGHPSQEDIKYHNYYQWVAYVLYLQAMFFYLPHFLWKRQNGRQLKCLINSKEDHIQQRLIHSRLWTLKLLGCELFNLINVISNIIFTDIFLGGGFLTLGVDIMRDGLESTVNPLDVIFPKVTKCTFYKYGPSGQLQPLDAICVMAVNILNEKAYTVLWFWFMFLLATSLLLLLWRLLSMCLYWRSCWFNQMVVRNIIHGYVNMKQMMAVSQTCSYSKWLLLMYFGANVEHKKFVSVIDKLAKEVDPVFDDYYDDLLDFDEESSNG